MGTLKASSRGVVTVSGWYQSKVKGGWLVYGTKSSVGKGIENPKP